MSTIDAVKREIRPWTSPDGQIRYYVDDWYDLVRDVIEPFVLQEWTAPRLDKIKRAKVWFDEDARIHVDRLDDPLTVEIIANNIEMRHYLQRP